MVGVHELRIFIEKKGKMFRMCNEWHALTWIKCLPVAPYRKKKALRFFEKLDVHFCVYGM